MSIIFNNEQIRIDMDLTRIQPRLNRMSEKGQMILASQVHADANMYAPRLSGDLRSQSMRVNNDKQIQWSVPYARYQWDGKPGWNYTTPGTGPRWGDVAKERHLMSWIAITNRTMWGVR